MAGAPILIIVVVVMAVLLLAAVFMTVVIFGHPDDKNTAYFPKAVTILGLWLAFASLLVMPYDVAASRGIDEPTIRVDVLWYIIYITLLILISAVIPFAIFFYESDVDPDVEAQGWGSTQWGSALKYTIGFLIFFFLVLGLMYTFLRNAIIPLQRQSNSIDLMLDLDDPTALFWQQFHATNNPLGKNQSPTVGCPEKFNGIRGCVTTSTTWEIPVSFPIYVMAFLAWVGWFFFATFAGVGFLALPMDLINEFRTRPAPMSTKVYFEERATLGRRAAQLIEVGNKMRENHESSVNKKSRRENARDMREFEKHFYNLKKDYQVLYIAHKLKGGNPLVPFLKLFLGICSIVISIAWLIQIINNIFARSPAFSWLNEFFITTEGAFNGGFPLFGVMFFAIFSFYLLVIVVKGSFKLGIRFLFWKVYPMEIGNTLMNAFLVNTWIILLTSVSAVQFCSQAFPVYTRLTTVDVIFGTQVYYLTFFRLFFINKVFIYIMVAISFLAFLYGVVRPTDKSANVEATLDRLAKSTSTSLHLRDAI